ncbi:MULTISPECIES: ROK family protein [unclassified Rhizobium]|uniref:ROK family protein n=1 Tax=unclassified Rhizobium TaxID=2613769 RepID=UPI0007E99DD9|nr:MULTISPECIES: ROK family protein [unclassified Rhizobium]ANM11170.1 ROK family transcriptional regulator protein [Rhizobium sp. N324]ANM17714.1 ROK family transcriptional regulator protein [Rhizobium sp. N541]ANM24100.1 ROK family transcriptional regulator protein [Rhizobium sp. N941]OYD04771.1 ROK family transcriptional regulator protein [Rhizobium sp. N4311]
MKLKGDQTTARAMNRRLILNLLRREGPRSRADIATVIGLSPAAVTFVISDLLEEGIVIEGQAVPGLAGRRPIPVEINYQHALAVGFKLMVNSVECVATDLATNPVAAMRVNLDGHDPDDVADLLAGTVPELVKLAGRPDAKLAGIGISMPGVINHEQTACVRSHRFQWDNVPLASLLAARVHVPVWLEDDTNAYAIAQQLFGLGRQHRNMAVLAVGVGISCALVIDGKLYRGANGAAGKFGHTLFEEGGRVCECGKRGCLMAYHSELSMLRRWREATGRGEELGLPELCEALASGDATALTLVGDAGRGIGTALANLVNITDPEVIVAGGEAVSLGDPFLTPLREALAARTFRTAPPLLPDWEDNSWARGAAALVTQKIFDFESSGGVTDIATLAGVRGSTSAA